MTHYRFSLAPLDLLEGVQSNGVHLLEHGLVRLRDAERRVVRLIEDVSDAINLPATGLTAFLAETPSGGGHWYFVCDRPEQAKAAASLLRALGLRRVEPVLLRDLAVCSDCVVAGWVSSSFARRLWAHTPRAVVALTDESDRRRWERAAEAQRHPGGQSLLGAVGGIRPASMSTGESSAAADEEHRADDDVDVRWGGVERLPCVFLWVTGETEAKVLEPDGRVVVEEGDVVRERVAARLRPDDRVILGLGTSRWSPADEFTGAVIDAVETSHPQLVKTAKEWRKALRQLSDDQRLPTPQLRARLAAVGVEREGQTLEGWLDVERASPRRREAYVQSSPHSGHSSSSTRNTRSMTLLQPAPDFVRFEPRPGARCCGSGRGGPLNSESTRRGSTNSSTAYARRFRFTKSRPSPLGRFLRRCSAGGFLQYWSRDSSRSRCRHRRQRKGEERTTLGRGDGSLGSQRFPESRDLVCNLDRSAQDVCLPDAQDGPARLLEHPSLSTIALYVAPNLRDPVRCVVPSGELGNAALKIAPVPEVTVAEDHEALLGEGDIRAPRQPRSVEPVTEAPQPECAPQNQLAARVLLAARSLCGSRRRGRRGP